LGLAFLVGVVEQTFFASQHRQLLDGFDGPLTRIAERVFVVVERTDIDALDRLGNSQTD
jgi:hypothetical protein